MILRNRICFSPLQSSGFGVLGLNLKEFQGIFFAQGFTEDAHPPCLAARVSLNQNKSILSSQPLTGRDC